MKQSQQLEACLRKCTAVKGLAFRTRGLVAEGLNQMAQSSSPAETLQVQERWMSAQETTRARLEHRFASLDVVTDDSVRELRGEVGRSRSTSPARSEESANAMRGASSSEESAIEEAGRIVGADARAISSYGQSNFEELSTGTISRQSATKVDANILLQLKVEPPNSEECAAKFALYEAYATEVEDMRDTIMKFHEQSHHLLPTTLAQSMRHAINSIDNRESMAIQDRTVEWFVYHMMRKAEQNNLGMAHKLGDFEKKIRYLAESCQTECPVCLEPFNEGVRRPETLRCCHKICADCWTRWSTVMHGLGKHPFCPCCNHCGFIGAVNAQVTGGVDLSDSDTGNAFQRSCSLFACGKNKGIQASTYGAPSLSSSPPDKGSALSPAYRSLSLQDSVKEPLVAGQSACGPVPQPAAATSPKKERKSRKDRNKGYKTETRTFMKL